MSASNWRHPPGRGAVKASAILAALVTFLAGALLLTPTGGAAGTAQALSLAILVQSVVLTVRLRPEFRLERILFNSRKPFGS